MSEEQNDQMLFDIIKKDAAIKGAVASEYNMSLTYEAFTDFIKSPVVAAIFGNHVHSYIDNMYKNRDFSSPEALLTACGHVIDYREREYNNNIHFTAMCNYVRKKFKKLIEKVRTYTSPECFIQQIGKLHQKLESVYATKPNKNAHQTQVSTSNFMEAIKLPQPIATGTPEILVDPKLDEEQKTISYLLKEFDEKIPIGKATAKLIQKQRKIETQIEIQKEAQRSSSSSSSTTSDSEEYIQKGRW